MEKRLNSLGQILVLFNEKDVTLDRHIKRLMVETPLLARILKETVEECRKMELEEIEKCFTAWHKNARDFSREMNCASFFLLYSYLTK